MLMVEVTTRFFACGFSMTLPSGHRAQRDSRTMSMYEYGRETVEENADAP